MDRKCFSLKDAYVLTEIYRHKWLESEKAGKDIGFLVAAEDWLRKYGNNWQDYSVETPVSNRIFIEKRDFRRFECDGCAVLVNEDGLCFAKVINLSFWGLLCRTPRRFILGNKIRIYLRFGTNNEETLNCVGTVSRVKLGQKLENNEVFFKFDDRKSTKLSFGT